MRGLALSALTLALLPLNSATAACGPIDGVEQVLQSPGVFVGDMHGSTQSAAFLSDLACHAIGTGRSVVIAMEYDAADQPVLDRFLQTADQKLATQMLTDTPYWKRNVDGRASSAMRDALLAIWKQVRDGARIELVAYDGTTRTLADRESAAAAILQSNRTPERARAFWIVFGGNVHARKTKGLDLAGAPRERENHEPLGYLIRDWGLIHLNARYHGGDIWGCTGPDTCEIHAIGPTCTIDCPPHPAIRLNRLNDAYDGVYDVGSLSPSPPLYWKKLAER